MRVQVNLVGSAKKRDTVVCQTSCLKRRDQTRYSLESTLPQQTQSESRNWVATRHSLPYEFREDRISRVACDLCVGQMTFNSCTRQKDRMLVTDEAAEAHESHLVFKEAIRVPPSKSESRLSSSPFQSAQKMIVRMKEKGSLCAIQLTLFKSILVPGAKRIQSCERSRARFITRHTKFIYMLVKDTRPVGSLETLIWHEQ